MNPARIPAVSRLATLLACGSLLVTAAVVRTAFAADVSVTGAVNAAQHSPSVAMTDSAIHVLYADQFDSAPAAWQELGLRSSSDGGATFGARSLPSLPTGWYWKPDGVIAFDGTLVWMVAQAQSPGTFEVGVWLSAGAPFPGATVAWSAPILLHSVVTTAPVAPTLALAVAEGAGAAQVLYLDAYAGAPGAVRHWHVPSSLQNITAHVLASNEPGVTFYRSHAIAAGADGKVLATYAKGPVSPTTDTAPLYCRESLDGGLTFGPEHYVVDVGYTPDGPGATTSVGNPVTALYARTDPYTPEARIVFWAGSYRFSSLYDPCDVFLTRSSTDPASWDPWGGTLPRGFGFYEAQPSVVHGDDGYFYLGWHDFEPWAPDSVSRFMVARLWNQGYSSSLPEPLASTTFDWDLVASPRAGMGWTSGADARAGRVAFAWGDHRGANPDIHGNAFHAEGLVLSECVGDTVDATPGSIATFAFRIENRNELFADEYSYGVTGTRSWTNGLEPDTTSFTPEGSGEVFYDVAVPDSAANGLVTIFAYAYDKVRFPSCPMVLRISGSLVDAPADAGRFARGLALAAPRPNPGPGPVSLPFTLPADAEIELAVFDLRGRRVASPGRGHWPAGEHVVRWDGKAGDGAAPGAGIYFARLTARAAGGEAPVVRERRLVRLR